MDLFGDALRDRENGRFGRMLTIRRDDDHVDSHDPALYFYDHPFAHEEDLLLQVQGPTLDIGCGAGRTVLWLEQQGIEATGIDLSPGAAEVCRRRGCRDIHHGDIMHSGEDTLAGTAFETVILFGNNLGIGGTVEGVAKLLHLIAQLTRPGGYLLATGLDVAQTEDPGHLAYHKANQAKGRPRGEITMRFEYEGETGDWVPWFHPEPHELNRLARDTGWHVVRIAPTAGPFFAATLRKPHPIGKNGTP